MIYLRLSKVAMLCALLCGLPTKRAQAQRLEFSGCSSIDQSRIRAQFKWLRLNQRDLVERIKSRQPTALSGRSENRMRTFFRKDVTKVQCSQDAVLCGAESPAYEIEALKFPLPHRYPLTLCMDYLQSDDALTIALAHQLGRHILINQDKIECAERCTSPNLAILFSQTAHSMLTGQMFSVEWCLTACAPPRETLDPTPSSGGPPNSMSGEIPAPSTGPSDEKSPAPTPSTNQ